MDVSIGILVEILIDAGELAKDLDVDPEFKNKRKRNKKGVFLV